MGSNRRQEIQTVIISTETTLSCHSTPPTSSPTPTTVPPPPLSARKFPLRQERLLPVRFKIL